jgi:hypothetical protein
MFHNYLKLGICPSLDVDSNSSLWSGCLCLISALKVTQITSGPVGLSLYHSGVEGHQGHFWAVRAASTSFRCRAEPISFRHQKIAKTTSVPVGPYLFHSGVEGSLKMFLGRWGCVYLIPLSKATKTTSGTVGLSLAYSGVEMLPRPLWGRSSCI